MDTGVTCSRCDENDSQLTLQVSLSCAMFSVAIDSDTRSSVERGLFPADQVRSMDVDDALVDTGATILSMPRKHDRGPWPHAGPNPNGGRQRRHDRRSTCTGPPSDHSGRDCPTDVSELPDECPVLIGQIPLEVLDFVVDMRDRRLIGNPGHGGEQVIELY